MSTYFRNENMIKMVLSIIFLYVIFFFGLPIPHAQAVGKSANTKNINMRAPIQNLVNYSQNNTDIKQLFAQRPITSVNPFNFIGYGIQLAVSTGVPIESLMLILSIPIIATIVIFLRYIVGFPTLGIAPTIVFAITFFVTGILFASILFATLLLATILSRILFKRIRIMQLAKVSLSMLVTSILTIVALVVSLRIGIIHSNQISIFPVLLFILLTEHVIALQLEKNLLEALGITLLTLLIGAIGFLLVTATPIRNFLLLYPEIIIILIPINWFIGRYFGLRLTEYFRFLPNLPYAHK